MRGNLLRDFVAFEYVLKCFDFETEFVSDVDEHQNLTDDIAVSMNVAFAFKHFNEWFQLQVSPRWNQILLTFCNCCLVFIPRLFVIASAAECLAYRFLNSHSGVWVTTSDAGLVRCA